MCMNELRAAKPVLAFHYLLWSLRNKLCECRVGGKGIRDKAHVLYTHMHTLMNKQHMREKRKAKAFHPIQRSNYSNQQEQQQRKEGKDGHLLSQ